MTESHLPPNVEWKVGDVVEAWGVPGKVDNIDLCDATLSVVFGDGHRIQFYSDGVAEYWHRTPSLRFISREKKKVRKVLTAYVNIYSSNYLGWTAWPTRDDADNHESVGRIACVELKGEYEVDEE